MDGPTDLLLALYRAAREQPIESFQDFALRLIKPLLQFDAAFWGAGERLESDAGVGVHIAQLHGIAQESLVEWQALNPHDKSIPALCKAPGQPLLFHSPTLFAGDQAMLDFTKRVGWQMSMVTAFLLPGERHVQWVSLYRPDAEHHYSEREQHLAKFIMPHLVEALTINRSLRLQSIYGDSASSPDALALCDRKGALHYADPNFTATLALEWPGFDGGSLPSALIEQCVLGRQRRYVGRSIRLEARDHDAFLFLRARRNSRLDLLSPREMMVARHFGHGQSHKETARSLDISPATVRHHLKSVYLKLDIHDKAQLAAAVEKA